MSSKITADHRRRAAVVYVRQSTMAQVMGNLESQRRQYDLAHAAEAAGFASVTVIDDDLGRFGSGVMERPGFERLVAMVCSGDVAAAYCIEASRLARSGRRLRPAPRQRSPAGRMHGAGSTTCPGDSARGGAGASGGSEPFPVSVSQEENYSLGPDAWPGMTVRNSRENIRQPYSCRAHEVPGRQRGAAYAVAGRRAAVDVRRCSGASVTTTIGT